MRGYELAWHCFKIHLWCHFYWWCLVSSGGICGHHRGSELREVEDLHCAPCDTRRTLYTPEGCDGLLLHCISHQICLSWNISENFPSPHFSHCCSSCSPLLYLLLLYFASFSPAALLYFGCCICSLKKLLQLRLVQNSWEKATVIFCCHW